MAVAGLHKASMLDSYLNENHSPASLMCGNKERSTTRTSSIRKMWLDLESEGRVGENGRRQMSGELTGPESQCSSSMEDESMESEDLPRDAKEIENECPQNRQEDDNRLCLQRSPSFDVQEKERVRKIFHEWGSKSFGSHTLHSSHVNNCSREQWLGENECKRVRMVREWIELSTQQGDTCRTGSEEPATEICSQIERVRDATIDCRAGARSSIRRIYGNQALVDLLTKFERERKRELEGLLENQLVSNFGHRQRIQSLLKGRFLLNQRFVEDEKPTSIAASELGLLRQTHVVSDIRKGFLSRLNNSDHAPEVAHSESDTSSDNDIKYDHTGQVEEIVHEILPLTVECTETRSQDYDDSVERNQNTYRIESSQGTLGTECIAHDPLPEEDEVMLGPCQSNTEELEIQVASVCLHPLQTSTDSFNWQEVSTQTEEWQELVTEDDDDGEGIEVNSNENEHEWYQETVRSDFQESHEELHDNVLEDSTESLFGENSYLEAALVGRSNAFYSYDGENRSRFELRELTSRRSVSNLLQSEFGSRLDRLMQTYVDRQDHAIESENGWMQDQEQQSVDENAGGIDAVDRTEGDHPSPSVMPQTQGDNDMQGAADRQFPDVHEHLGTEREIINGLRIGMNTLEQRMNDMQRMVEACMDMQLQLQRSMQQEVYSALNRSSNSRVPKTRTLYDAWACEEEEEGIWNYQSESSPGKEGVCYLCHDDGFDSVPDKRYICSKCAQKIDWSKLKESVRHP